MMKENIFLEDVEVPDVVQQKADNAFLTIEKERNFKMKNRMKKKRTAGILIAAAACMAVVIAAGTLASPMKGILGHSGAAGDIATQETEDELLAAIDKMFTLQVKAAECEEGQLVPLTEGQPIPIMLNDDKGSSWVLGSDGESVVDYCINLPQLTCEGENIESITYSINQGAFQIVQPENEKSIIVDGQLYDGKLVTGSIGGDYSEERDGQPSKPFEIVLYESFTLDYDKQSDEYTWMNICNERSDSEEIVELIWKEGGTEEEHLSGVQKMLADTVITCTVNYTDHTSKSADIKVDSCIMTRREAGEQLDPGMEPEDLEKTTTVITFEQQPEVDVQ